MIAYLLKSTLCLLMLLLAYHALLAKEPMHQFNRYFLLFSLVFGFSIPLVPIHLGQGIQLSNQINELNRRLRAPAASDTAIEVPKAAKPESLPEATSPRYSIPVDIILWSIYLFGVMLFFGRFCRNGYQIWKKITQNERATWHDTTLILTHDGSSPHSFLGYLFVARQQYKSGALPIEIVAHEAVHIRQRHSLDVLFIEILNIAFWFNPLLWFYKKAIQTNHEYLADAGALATSAELNQYRQLLLQMKASPANAALSSALNFSLTKKRIMMMTTQSPRWKMRTKIAALVPMIVGLVFAFSSRTAAQNVAQLSFSELVEAVSQRMDAMPSLTEADQQRLRKLILQINDQMPPPPPPALPSDTDLDDVSRIYSDLINNYLRMDAATHSNEEMKGAYMEMNRMYDKWNPIFKENNKYKPLPPLPAKKHDERAPNKRAR